VWAGLWFLIARSLAPRAAPWAAATLFVLPLPLVQRAALSATSITAHLGSSMWHAAALWAVVCAGRSSGSARLGWIALSGGVVGVGLYCGFSLAPLLLGVAWAVWRTSGPAGVATWSAGALPGLGLARAFRDPSRAGADLITALTGLQEGGTFREAGLSTVLDTVVTAARYGAGFGRVDVATADLEYLSVGLLYSLGLLGLVIAAVRWAGRTSREEPTAEAGLLGVSLGLSALGFVGALAVTGFKLETTFFDGLRYLLPLAPGPPLVILWAVDRLVRGGIDPRRATPALVAPLLVAHLLGFGGHFRADVFPAPWWDVRGYEPWVMKNHLQRTLQLSEIERSRRYRWAIWSGLSEARKASRSSLGDWGPAGGPIALPVGAEPEVVDDFLRGVGMGLILRAAQETPGELPALPLGVPRTVRLRLIEGLAMGHAHVGCSDTLRDALLDSALDPAARSAAWYGLGRADLYCLAFSAGRPPGADEEAYQGGLADAVARDYGPGIVFLRVY
jgi:hypothetical protein